jgi:hypothetical protein
MTSMRYVVESASLILIEKGHKYVGRKRVNHTFNRAIAIFCLIWYIPLVSAVSLPILIYYWYRNLYNDTNI